MSWERATEFRNVIVVIDACEVDDCDYMSELSSIRRQRKLLQESLDIVSIVEWEGSFFFQMKNRTLVFPIDSCLHWIRHFLPCVTQSNVSNHLHYDGCESTSTCTLSNVPEVFVPRSNAGRSAFKCFEPFDNGMSMRLFPIYTS